MDGMAATLSSRWFDGRSPRPQPVTLRIDEDVIKFFRAMGQGI